MQTPRFGLLALAAIVTAAAQDKVIVALSSPSQPATVQVHLINGSIRVTAGTEGQVVVDSPGRSRPEPVPPGMHRLDMSSSGVRVLEDHNVVSIEAGGWARGTGLNLQVPHNSSLKLKTINSGHIEVTGINGAIEVEDINGAIVLKDVSGSVVASSQNGSITVSLDKVAADQPMSFTTLNGRIDVTIPADTKARLRLKAQNGAAYSDFDMKMEPDPNRSGVAAGMAGYRSLTGRSILGSINGGGPEYRFQTLNGSILLHRR